MKLRVAQAEEMKCKTELLEKGQIHQEGISSCD